MTRAIWKGPFINDFILKQVYALKRKQNLTHSFITIWSKQSIIFPSFVGISFKVYNGQKFMLLVINENMVGFRFGEFLFTRRLTKHKKKN